MSLASRCIALLDLTSLQDNDTDESIRDLCAKANTPLGKVAAVCVYPQFVSTAAQSLKDSNIEIATVINFPTGQLPASQCRNQISKAIADGASEIDFVIDWRKFNQHGATQQGINELRDYVQEMVKYCGTATTKAILETGHLASEDLIRKASEICLDAGVTFLKTSTGKMPTGATLQAARVMLQVLKAKKLPHCGLKVAGGVRTVNDAASYIDLASESLGNDFVSKATFRIGASGLRDALLKDACPVQ